MKRSMILGAVFTAVLVLVLPFVGGGGPSFLTPASAAVDAAAIDGSAAGALVASTRPVVASPVAAPSPTSDPVAAAVASIDVEAAAQADVTVETEHVAQKPVPKPVPRVSATGRASGTIERQAALEAAGQSCPENVGGSTGSAPGATSPLGVAGTTTADLASFAATYNAIRVANCLPPVPMANFRYDSCMEARLFWMAEDPSTDPASAWGHKGQAVRSDGVADTGCDGNLAGGSGNTGATVAQKWWNSEAHRNSLYRPMYTGSTAGVCVLFAMTHGGVPNEPYSFTRAAARWVSC